uniref:WAT1-related protein At3g28050-like isoform X3 n=1 Tax=Rhizophora mucronata TaxID=61149 RepID=A0A2P2IJW3_RHIMU
MATHLCNSIFLPSPTLALSLKHTTKVSKILQNYGYRLELPVGVGCDGINLGRVRHFWILAVTTFANIMYLRIVIIGQFGFLSSNK